MTYKHPSSPDTPFVPCKYSLLEPITVRIRRPSGEVQLVSYGIGEIVEVMQPKSQYLVCCYERLTEIPLSDGSAIIDFPDGIRASRV